MATSTAPISSLASSADSAAVSASAPLYRIGAVSKTTGVPVSTLRVWETRYAAFSPVKTAGQQRLFGEQDVSKAHLLKQLSQAGHAISAIAGLDLDQLRRMSHVTRAPAALGASLAATGQALSMAVVGMAMANRIESPTFARISPRLVVKVTQVWADLDAAKQAITNPESPLPPVLLVKVNTLQPSAQAAIAALVQQHGFTHTIVVYHFATEAVVQAMAWSGVTLRREPISDTELAGLLASSAASSAAPLAQRPPLPEPGLTSEAIPARQYSDATLTRVAGMSTPVLCECPRHVAELIAQLASFEEYSQECLNKSDDDAQLHSYLTSVAGSARVMFEAALKKVAEHEGIDLRERAA